MDTKLESLDPKFQPLARTLLKALADADIPTRVINTRRTDAEQLQCLKNKVSWKKRSPHQDGLAIDVCPVALLARKGWDPGNFLWAKVGEIGESVGLIWGGRWKVKDLDHFEMPKPGVGVKIAPTPPGSLSPP